MTFVAIFCFVFKLKQKHQKMSIFRRALSLALRPPVSGHRVLAARRLPSWGPPRVPVDRKSVEERVLSTLAKHDKVDPSAVISLL